MTASWIAGLMRADYPALGFIPEATIERRYIAKNRYILQTDERGRHVGYLLHGAIHYGQPVVITQAMIDYDYRLRGYGQQTIAVLVRRAELGGVSSIRLRVAADLPAVNFWHACGFEAVGCEPGGKARDRMIIKFVKLLPLPFFRKNFWERYMLEFGLSKPQIDATPDFIGLGAECFCKSDTIGLEMFRYRYSEGLVIDRCTHCKGIVEVTND